MRKILYGVSSKFNFDTWSHTVYGPFATEDDAIEWLHTEEYDFREREIMGKTEAIKFVGKNAVNNAIDYYEEKAIRENYYL